MKRTIITVVVTLILGLAALIAWNMYLFESRRPACEALCIENFDVCTVLSS
jgi:Tfp pilus assembly protein PilE